ncbi:hypothetical protein D3C78_1063360 [compost metagenome]
MAGGVDQLVTAVVRGVEEFRVRVGVGGDQIPALAESAVDVHLHAARAHLAGGLADAVEGDHHVFLLDVVQGDVGAELRGEVELGADLAAAAFLRVEGGGVGLAVRLVGFERLAVVGVERELRVDGIDQAGEGQEGRPAVVDQLGIAAAQALLQQLPVMLVATAEHQDPLLVQVPVVLGVQRGGVHFVAAVALRAAERGGGCQAAVARVVDVQRVVVGGVAPGVAAEIVDSLVVDAQQQVVAGAEQLGVADPVPGQVVHLVAVFGAVGAAAQGAGAGQGGLAGGGNGFGEVEGFLIPAVAQAVQPVGVEPVFGAGVEDLVGAFALRPGLAELLVVAGVGDLAVDQHRAAVDRGGEALVLVGQVDA